MRYAQFLIGGALVLSLAAGAQASPVASGFNTTSLGTCDDCYSTPVSLGFSPNFYGTTYSEVFVNNNGNLTFNAGLQSYTPYGIYAIWHWGWLHRRSDHRAVFRRR